MRNKKPVFLVVAALLMLIYLQLKKVGSEHKSMVEVASVLDQVGSDYSLIDIGRKLDTEPTPTDVSKNLNLEEFMVDFFSRMNSQSIEDRWEALREFVEDHNISLIGYHRDFYQLIVGESDPDLRDELLLLFFDMYYATNQNGEMVEVTSEQHEEIKELVSKMIQNPETRDDVIGRESSLLSSEEIESLYHQYVDDLTAEQKIAILDSYMNTAIIAGKDPCSGPLSKEVQQHITNQCNPP